MSGRVGGKKVGEWCLLRSEAGDSGCGGGDSAEEMDMVVSRKVTLRLVALDEFDREETIDDARGPALRRS